MAAALTFSFSFILFFSFLFKYGIEKKANEEEDEEDEDEDEDGFGSSAGKKAEDDDPVARECDTANTTKAKGQKGHVLNLLLVHISRGQGHGRGAAEQRQSDGGGKVLNPVVASSSRKKGKSSAPHM